MVYLGLIKVMPDDFGQRSPSHDPEGDYMTLDEKSDRQADNTLEEWKRYSWMMARKYTSSTTRR